MTSSPPAAPQPRHAKPVPCDPFAVDSVDAQAWNAYWKRRARRQYGQRAADVLGKFSASPLAWGLELDWLAHAFFQAVGQPADVLSAFAEKRSAGENGSAAENGPAGENGRSAARGGSAGQVTRWFQSQLKCLDRLARGRKPPERQVATLLATLRALPPGLDSPPSLGESLFYLATSYALPSLGDLLPPVEFLAIADRLARLAHDAQASDPSADPLGTAWMGCELGLVLTALFPDSATCRSLKKPARKKWAELLEAVLDGEGLPHVRHWVSVRPLLASLARTQRWALASRETYLNSQAQAHYELLVRQALRLTRPDGTSVLAGGQPWNPDLLRCVLEQAGDRSDRLIATAWGLPGLSGKRRKLDPLEMPSVPHYSEWSEGAVLRSSWSRKSPQLTVSFAEGRLRTELSNGRHLVWSGETRPRVTVDGREFPAPESWSEVCWYTDSDVDYLELEAEWSGGWRVQRQFLLCHTDRFLFLADAVLGPSEAEIGYRSLWPLVEGVSRAGAEETRDGWLRQGERDLALVLPLSLPEWRQAPATGHLPWTGPFELALQSRGRAAYAATFWDLDRRRMRNPQQTWRQLTIAENLKIAGPDVAVGFRVQLGRKQWLFYRALAPAASRTVLGQNFSCEFYAGRFHRSGEVDQLIEIEME